MPMPTMQINVPPFSSKSDNACVNLSGVRGVPKIPGFQVSLKLLMIALYLDRSDEMSQARPLLIFILDGNGQ
jgi:hypothetical protein